ncbi:MAG: DinB family protein [Flavisolibacter sp.]
MDFIKKLDALATQVQDSFGSLNTEQLNWKPQPGQWSIAQCLDHLIVSNNTYFPTFDKVLNEGYRLTLLQKMNPFKKSLGAMMIKSLGPGSSKKFTAPQIFTPSSSDVSGDIVSVFVSAQNKLKTYFQNLSEKDSNKILIASPVSSFITYSLADAMEIITVHEQRHVNQALKVFHQPNFPMT